MEIDRTFVIFDCKPNGSDLFFGGAIVLSQTLGDSLAFGNIDFERNYKAIHSMLNNRMWMVHDKVNCARLTYGCNKIGKPPPTPTSVIDTSLFTSSKTKLGRAAVMFGLGNGPNGYESNLSAILACTEIMSKLDVPMETLNDTVHPMIYYLMQYNDQMNDEVRARYFNEAEYPSLNKIDDIPIMMLVDDVLTTRKAEFKKLYSERQKQKEDDDDDDDNHFVVCGKAVVKPKELYIAGLKQLKTGSLLRPVYHDYNNILSRKDDDDDEDSDNDQDQDMMNDDD
ncbi:hypothetical protein ISN45_Aa03g036900 [Arabidopsis thaliana x Arabidopsis arenosa]|uniref:Uncharacterized protein n=1 Tax=Arabidopsis thaliana x Arabidopsis arenosa TaxID=1240361 RepID=A0A8T2B3H7_9BRAS|nr:hypothetical protein ISN45_Aa03g036900 [Arabidopsis thaliana x Arabidopsis arenosa]